MSNSDDFAALRTLRVGCVKYLNSEPLIHHYDGAVRFAHPSALASDLAAGTLDVALVPTFHALSHPEYHWVDGVAIACNGPVYSVVLAYQGAITSIKSISLDPASLSSAHLVQVLLAEFYGVHVNIQSASSGAQLLIGNQAIEQRQYWASAQGWNILDLGAAWKQHTGLPFVFALWAIRASVPNPHAIAEAFRSLKSRGVTSIPQIVEHSSLMDAAFRTRYLTEHISFEMGANEKLAITRYRELLKKYGLIERVDFPLHFV